MTGLEDGKRGRFDKERTRQEILEAATHEFVEHGLAGARVEAIAARTATVKRMIYYYFGSKEGLYLAVLEQAYAGIRTAEMGLDLLVLEPVEAIRRLVEFTFDYHEANPGFSRLVSIENIHNGAHMARSEPIHGVNQGVIEIMTAVISKGQQSGAFRRDERARRSHADQRLLLLPRLEPPHLRPAVQLRPAGAGAARPPQAVDHRGGAARAGAEA